MKILLNFLPLKTGGGIQVALDFLKQAELYGTDHEWYLVARMGTPFESYNDSGFIKSVTFINDSILSRLYFEHISCIPLIKNIEPDVIYTQFGPHWPGAKSIKNVVGCAYSNLFYPEIDFWGKLPVYKQIVKKVIDFFRKKRILNADLIIFETEDLAHRASIQNNLPDSRVSFVRPAASSLIDSSISHSETKLKCDKLPDGFKVLLLAGYHPNKNIELLPKILSVIQKKYDNSNVKFIITLPDGVYQQSEVLNIARETHTESSVYNFGPVPYEGCPDIYNAVDAVILPAQLESFSNNIAESWAMKKPFLISDLDWSRSICGSGAVYFKYDDPYDAAEKIISIIDNEGFRKKIINEGVKMLETYPTSKERFLNYLNLIICVAKS